MAESWQPPAGWVEDEEREGCAADLEWMIKGLVLSCTSGRFYRRMAERGVILAIIFLLLFGLAQTAVPTVRMVRMLGREEAALARAYERGEIPEITIRDGVVEVGGPQPLVLLDEDRMLMVIDTSGTYKEIDTAAYDDGLLLTERSFHVLDSSGYERYSVQDLHAIFGNPIVISEQMVRSRWHLISVIAGWVVFIGLLLWHTLLKLGALAALGLGIWGMASLLRPGTRYGPVLITGIYASVPATYGRWFLNEAGLRVFGLYWLLLLGAWGLALHAVLQHRAGREDQETGAPLGADPR
jgi:hypothetical protein